jgi:hypothetical protein
MRDHRRLGFGVTHRKGTNLWPDIRIDRCNRVVQQLIGAPLSFKETLSKARQRTMPVNASIRGLAVLALTSMTRPQAPPVELAQSLFDLTPAEAIKKLFALRIRIFDRCRIFYTRRARSRADLPRGLASSGSWMGHGHRDSASDR